MPDLNDAMIRFAQRVTPQHPSSKQWCLRVDGVEICGATFETISLSNEAVAAGMASQDNIVSITIYGNRGTDPTIETRLKGDLFEVSNDGGTTYKTVTLLDTIRNDGFKWFFRVQL